MPRKKKTKSQSNLITEYKEHKAEDEVVYKRLSDGKLSVGIIKYFHLSETVCATIIDLQLSNYQTGLVDEFVKDPSQDLIKSLWSKIANKSQRRKSKK